MTDKPRVFEGTQPLDGAQVAKLRANYYRTHIGCNVTTCPNGKCNATGECQDNPVR